MRGMLVAATGGAIAVGLMVILVVAPLSVATDLAYASGALATSPNLAATLGHVVVWSMAVALLGAAFSIASRSASIAARTGLSVLLVGLAWMSLVLVTATMSNAIADAGAVHALPQILAGWLSVLGVALTAAGSSILLACSLRDGRRRGPSAGTGSL